MKRRGGGWWMAGLAVALVAPTLAPGPVAAGPFDYIQKTDEQKNQNQRQNREQERRQAEEGARQQREQRERQRAEQEQRSRQEQERRAAEERQRQAGQQRQAEQQRQAQREQQERARVAQEARERERQRVEADRARQEQRAREAQVQRAREEQHAREAQVQREQSRRAYEERVAREQVRRAREEQAPTVRRVASGPFDYIRRTDEVRNQGSQNSPQRQQPVYQRSQPAREPQSPVARPQPFGYIPGQRGSATPVPGSPHVPFRPASPPAPPARGYPPSPFGTVRPGWPPVAPTRPAPTEVPRPRGSFPPSGGYRGNFPGVTGVPAPFGSMRGRAENGTGVTPMPRRGHGTLGSYFGRDPHRPRERGYYPGSYYSGPYYGNGYYPYPYYPAPYYPGRFDRYYPYLPDGYYACPYDLYPYPPTVYYLQPVPSVVVVPEPETIIVPAPEPVVVEPRRQPEVVESVTLDEVIADIEEAWERDRLSLLMRHVRQDGQIQVYRSGEWIDTLSRTQFEQKTEQAFREYDTVSMTFEKPELLGRDESGAPGARARGTHVYKTRDGGERRVHVTYAFRKYGWSWYVVGLDYEPTPRQDAAAPESTPNAAPARGYPVTSRTALAPAHYALPVAGQLRLVSAPPVRVRDLLNARQPRPLATVKWLQSSGRTFYTLQAMRGVVPGTVAWALYRKGEKRPVETGAADVGALPLNGWIAVRPQGPQLVMLASQAPARRRHPHAGTRLLATHTFPDASLALVPAKPAHNAKPGHKGRRFRMRKLRRV